MKMTGALGLAPLFLLLLAATLRISLIVITHSGIVIRCFGCRDHGVGAERR